MHFGGAPLAPHLIDEIRPSSVFPCSRATRARRRRSSAPRCRATHRNGNLDGGPADARRRGADRGRRAPASSRCNAGAHRGAVSGDHARLLAHPEATSRALDDEGWLYTEDMGLLDEDGYLHLLGREKDLFFRSALNVYPGEVEDELQTHPQVAQARSSARQTTCSDKKAGRSWSRPIPRGPRPWIS